MRRISAFASDCNSAKRAVSTAVPIAVRGRRGPSAEAHVSHSFGVSARQRHSRLAGHPTVAAPHMHGNVRSGSWDDSQGRGASQISAAMPLPSPIDAAACFSERAAEAAALGRTLGLDGAGEAEELVD